MNYEYYKICNGRKMALQHNWGYFSQCGLCLELNETKRTTQVNNKAYCDGCLTKCLINLEFFTCSMCTKTCNRVNMVLHDNRECCKKCVTSQCASCMAISSIKHMTNLNNKTYCNVCVAEILSKIDFFTCNMCYKTCNKKNRVPHGNKEFCNICVTSMCDSCWTVDSIKYMTHLNNKTYCNKCINKI